MTHSLLETLYQQTVLHHNRNPLNTAPIAHPTAVCEAVNPLCGDKLKLSIQLRPTPNAPPEAEPELCAICIEPEGCALCVASASLMSRAVATQDLDTCRALSAAFQALVVEGTPSPLLADSGLEALQGVRAFPLRVKCVTLPWHTLDTALTESLATLAARPPAPDPEQSLIPRIWEALAQIYDPELPVNIVDLGLIYDVICTEPGVYQITMTLTTPNCPAAESLPQSVQNQVLALSTDADPIRGADIRLVFDPPWDQSRMTDAARFAMGLL